MKIKKYISITATAVALIAFNGIAQANDASALELAFAQDGDNSQLTNVNEAFLLVPEVVLTEEEVIYFCGVTPEPGDITTREPGDITTSTPSLPEYFCDDTLITPNDTPAGMCGAYNPETTVVSMPLPPEG